MTELETIAEKIVHEIQGTSGSLDNLLEENSVVDNMTVLNYIDDQIFRCEQCDWWCEISEMSETCQICTDCCND